MLVQLRNAIQIEDWFLGIRFPSNPDEDIIYISDRFGCALEDCLAGYANLNPQNASEIILIGGFWNRIIESIDQQIGAPAITNQILKIIGTKQGERLANGIVKIILGNPPEIASMVQKGTSPASTIIIKTSQSMPDFSSTLKVFFRGYGYGIIDEIVVDHTQGPNGIVLSVKFKNSFFFQNGRECSFMEALLSAFFTALLNEPHDFSDSGNHGRRDQERTFSNV